MPRPTTAAIALTDDDYIVEPGGLRYPARTVPEGFDALVPYVWVDDLELRDSLGRLQVRVTRDRAGAITGVVVDPLPLTDMDRAMLRRQRIRERVDPVDIALALTGDAAAVDRVRQVVEEA